MAYDAHFLRQYRTVPHPTRGPVAERSKSNSLLRLGIAAALLSWVTILVTLYWAFI